MPPLGYRYVGSIDSNFAVMADRNPGSPEVLQVRPDSPLALLRSANSRNHGGHGQNVLYLDGHIEFRESPFCGVKRDMIWARRKSATGFESTGIATSPLDDLDDSVLLPAEE